jgi:hypothetical protein
MILSKLSMKISSWPWKTVPARAAAAARAASLRLFYKLKALSSKLFSGLSSRQSLAAQIF